MIARVVSPPLLVVAAALIDPAGRVCMQRRPLGRQHGGLWEFPGGKVEPGEDPRTAICREIAEELGVELDPEQLAAVAFAGSGAVVILLYATRTWRGQAHALDAQTLAWTAPEALAGLAMPPLDYPLAAQLQRVLSTGAF